MWLLTSFSQRRPSEDPGRPRPVRDVLRDTYGQVIAVLLCKKEGLKGKFLLLRSTE